MHIGILQAGHLPEALIPAHGTYPDLYARLLAGQGFRFSSWDVVDMAFPEAATACDGWLISGSKHGAYEDLPFIAPLEAFIRDAQAAKVPTVGICFGHQIMAQALGGTVEKFDGGWAVGRQSYQIGRQVLTSHAWHQDQVITPPEHAIHIGKNDFCEYAALAYGDTGLSFQPHPEFDGDFVTDLAENRGRGVVPDALLETAIATAHDPVDIPDFAQMIGALYRKGPRP